MASKEPVLYYFEGRGKGEIVRLTLCAGKFKFQEKFIKNREDFLKLLNDGRLRFRQVPMLEMDGKDLVQTDSIVRHLARKGKLMGQNEDEAMEIESLFDGTRDSYQLFYGFNMGMTKPNEELKAGIQKTVLPKMLPIYNKILEDNKDGYLVGGRLSLADVGLFEVLQASVDYLTTRMFGEFPGIQVFYKQMLSLPEIDHYMKNVRQRMNDDVYKNEVYTSLGWN